MHAKRVTHRPS